MPLKQRTPTFHCRKGGFLTLAKAGVNQRTGKGSCSLCNDSTLPRAAAYHVWRLPRQDHDQSPLLPDHWSEPVTSSLTAGALGDTGFLRDTQQAAQVSLPHVRRPQTSWQVSGSGFSERMPECIWKTWKGEVSIK